MKRLKSSDDLNSYGGEKAVFKDWGRRDEDPSFHQSSSHRNFHYKSESATKGLSSSSSRYERAEDDRKNSRLIRKRPDYDGESYERRKSYDRYRDSSDRGILSSSPRGGYGGDRIHRSESFSGPRRDFPKGFRSERDRSRREGSVSSWRRFGGGKDVDESAKSGGDSVKGSKAASEETGNVRSPQGGRDTRSPPWSKDSGSEHSKSVEIKKGESFPAESGNNSEREEGELDPDPEPAPTVENAADDQSSEPVKTSQEVQHENAVDDRCLEDKAKLLAEEEIKPDQTRILAEKAVVEEPETLRNVVKKVSKSSSSQDSLSQRTGDNGKKDVECVQDYHACEEEARSVPSGSLQLSEVKPKQDNDTFLEVKGDNTGNAEGHDTFGVVNQSLVTKELTQNFKDKGKNVVVSVSSGADSLENSLRIENESRGFMTNDMEGSSTRGFDLFFTDPIKKPENVDQRGLSKPKDEKLSLEPLELSLRLPNVLLPIGSQNQVCAPDSPSQEMSIQSHASSFQTSSDGFTSFSGSHHFTHNPSCSLTENSFDFEQSVGSRPLFQGVAWQVQSSDDHRNGELPVHQSSLSNGNGSFHKSQAVQVHGSRVAEGSYKTPLGLEMQPSGSHLRHMNEIRTPTQSHETGSEYRKERKRIIGALSKSTNSRDEKEKLFTGPTDLVEPLLAMVVSDPLHIVARILNEMTGHSLACLKESARDVILNPSKRRQLSTFQKTIEKRLDITMEMLLKAHSVQTEILVALKTGIQDFLQTNSDISSSDLAEIFLNTRCRNLTCRSYLPVDECDCKICVQKNGFCSACMCLVCSKFDMASNTCSWVGCDVCLHWCHTDCGLRESYIRNGRSAATGAQGQTEMQFHCVACDHPSEMFGFVREVFQNFAKGWTAETLLNELEYVRRIFSASEDIRGKRLHEISLQMLARLSNKSDLQQVRGYVMGFLSDDDGSKLEKTDVWKQTEKQGEGNKDVGKSRQEWAKAPREAAVFDELDGIVRIKLAEAQMFQMRADDARREAEGLSRIAQAKSKKIEEEFASRVAKLQLSEAEEVRRQKLQELQALENAHQEYFNMKVRMEREIKDLLLKMEATKRNFTS